LRSSPITINVEGSRVILRTGYENNALTLSADGYAPPAPAAIGGDSYGNLGSGYSGNSYGGGYYGGSNS
jgi:hypothetical protein